MPTLKEIKGRMGSVASTLKITSAMKLVSSAKLRKAQSLAEAMIPYQRALESILADLSAVPSGPAPAGSGQYSVKGPAAPSGPAPAGSGQYSVKGPPTSWAPPRQPGTQTLPVVQPAPEGTLRAEGQSGQGDASKRAWPSSAALEGGTQRAEGQAEPGYSSESVAARGLVNGRGPRSGRDLLSEEYPGSAEAPGEGKAAIVAVASNASLCGGFNANVLRALMEAVRGWEAAGVRVEVYAIGRRLYDAARKAGLPLAPDQPLAILPDRLTYAQAASFADSLIESYAAGRYARIDLIWNHFVSTGSQKVTSIPFLPLDSSSSPASAGSGQYSVKGPAAPLGPAPAGSGQYSVKGPPTSWAPPRQPGTQTLPVVQPAPEETLRAEGQSGQGDASKRAWPSSAALEGGTQRAEGQAESGYSSESVAARGLVNGRGPRSGRDLLSEEYPGSAEAEEYIVEPSREEVMERLMPKVLKLKVYATLLDSLAAEHAARMVAMQTATDNGEDLLQELTLEYNKGRQQKITAEILDLAGGALR